VLPGMTDKFYSCCTRTTVPSDLEGAFETRTTKAVVRATPLAIISVAEAGRKVKLFFGGAQGS